MTPERIETALYGFMRSQLLITAVELDVFTPLAERPMTLPALAATLNLPERSLGMLLDGLVGLQWLQKSADGHYQLPPDVARYLVRSAPEFLGGLVNHCRNLSENWAQLTSVVQMDQPAGGAQGLDAVESRFAELVQGLAITNASTAHLLAERLKSLPYGRVLDVGGGSAVWSRPLVAQNPDSTGTVLDLPGVIPVARRAVAQDGLTERYTFVGADMEVWSFPPRAFDLVLMGHVCHTLGQDSLQALFYKLSATLTPGGHLAIIDFVPDDARSQSGFPLVFGVNMLVATPEGNVYTGAQYRQWLTAAGFSGITVQPLEAEVSLVLAQLPA
jgi:ubiquinone/menaquinone biosynthesis C-methylase UbiE